MPDGLSGEVQAVYFSKVRKFFDSYACSRVMERRKKMSEKEYALRMLDEIRNRDGIGYNDYSDLWDAISEIPVEEEA